MKSFLFLLLSCLSVFAQGTDMGDVAWLGNGHVAAASGGGGLCSTNDNFNRANENPLSDAGAWHTVTSSGAMAVTNNQVLIANPAGSDSDAYFDGGVSWSANQYSQLDIVSADTIGNAHGGIGPSVRVSSSSRTYYRVILNQATANNLYLSRRVSGTGVPMQTNTIAFISGETLRLEVTGTGASTTLTVKTNGVQVYTFTDSTGAIASGFPGIGCGTDTSLVYDTGDNWAGGCLP